MLSAALLRSVTTFYATILNSRFLRLLTDNQIEFGQELRRLKASLSSRTRGCSSFGNR
jgi:hypothetical protein